MFNIGKINRKKLVLYTVLFIITLFFLLRVFLKKDEISYITEPVKKNSIKKVVNATGEVGAVELVNVGAQVSGKIEKLYVDLGQKVKKGDMIVQIDSTTQQNDVDINKAKLESYKAQLQASKISLKVAQSKYERTKKLFKGNASSKENLENMQNEYENARSNVIQLESLVKQTRISLSTAQTNLGYTKIVAPLDGTIVSVPVKEGQTVNSAMSTPTIVQIADLSEMEVLMEISEGDIIGVKPGLKVSYTILGENDEIYETTLKSIDPALTLLTNGKYTGVVGSTEAIYYYGRLVIPNNDEKLRIGMTTQNIIHVETANNVLVIPAIGIIKENDDEYVYILKDKKAVKKKILTGVSNNMLVEVVSGLSEGDEVILAKMSSKEITERVNDNPMKRGR